MIFFVRTERQKNVWDTFLAIGPAGGLAVVCYQLSVSVVGCLLWVVGCQFSVICYKLFVVSFPLRHRAGQGLVDFVIATQLSYGIALVHYRLLKSQRVLYFFH